MSRLPLHPVDANDPKLRGPAVTRDHDQRIASLERRANGLRGAGRWYSAAVLTPVNTGWSWVATGNVSTGLPPDDLYYQIVTPAGSPYGSVAAGSNSGIKVLVSGVYRINFQALQYFSSGTSGRVDSSIGILTAAGAVYANISNDLVYVPAATLYVHTNQFVECLLDAGQIVMPLNSYGQGYGDASGSWSNLTMRYMG